ncbi:maestro heat-like repeat family member 5 [Podarcis lilfordi]|uniref:Maestro heat-like repeat family member 5 n=1 Tax=Podarcis lilfordi TaxID=74358 RepID=A0AA35QQF3_9SAUR|nr:maestro heat-like repeat family member 5 [Podarcis lilfordi]
MLTSLLSEAPSLETLQEILVHTNGWIDSTKISERQRAVKTTNVLMKYVSEHLDFDVSQDFPLLGQLVALLSIHLTDNVKEIGLQSAEALYHLHYIMIAKMGKELEKRRNKNKKGNMVRWVREDFFIPGPSLFHYNIAKVAKAFGEHLTPSQINEVVLKAIDNLTVEDRAVSQAAGKLLRSFLEECGMDMEDLPMVVKEIYNHLHRIPDTRTKDVTLSAIVSLATKRLQPVVDSLLDCSKECDESTAVIWKALVADPYSSVKLLRPLLKRLQDEDPKAEVPSRRCSTSQMPMAATNALCHILSFPEAAGILKSKFPHLLFALSTQICFVHEARRRGSRATSLIPEPSSHLDPLTIAVQALKQLIGRVEYLDDFEVLELQSCWDMLSSPESFFQGIRLLARTLYTSSKEQYKRIARLAREYMCCPSNKKRAIGMAFYLEGMSDSDTDTCQSLNDLRCCHCLFWLLKPQRPALLPLPLLAVKASTTCAAPTATSGCQSLNDLRCCHCLFWLLKPQRPALLPLPLLAVKASITCLLPQPPLPLKASTTYSAATALSGCQSLNDLRCCHCLFWLSKPQQPALLPLPLLAVKASMTCSATTAPSGCESLDDLLCCHSPFWLSKPQQPALLPLPLLAVKASTTSTAATASSGCQSLDDLRCCRYPFWLSKPR